MNNIIVMHNKVCYFLPYLLLLNIPTAIMCTACDIASLKFAKSSFVHFTTSYCMTQCNRLGEFHWSRARKIWKTSWKLEICALSEVIMELIADYDLCRVAVMRSGTVQSSPTLPIPNITTKRTSVASIRNRAAHHLPTTIPARPTTACARAAERFYGMPHNTSSPCRTWPILPHQYSNINHYSLPFLFRAFQEVHPGLWFSLILMVSYNVNPSYYQFAMHFPLSTHADSIF